MKEKWLDYIIDTEKSAILRHIRGWCKGYDFFMWENEEDYRADNKRALRKHKISTTPCLQFTVEDALEQLRKIDYPIVVLTVYVEKEKREFEVVRKIGNSIQYNFEYLKLAMEYFDRINTDKYRR